MALELLAGSIGGSGNVDGTGATARFSGPNGVAVDRSGNVYVADGGNATIRKITAAGVVTTLAGAPGMLGSVDGTGADARFTSPAGLATDSAGNLYVTDGGTTIRKVTPAGVVTTLAGTAGVQGSADGTGAAARFNIAIGVAVDGPGNVYVADSMNATVRKVTPAGVVTTLAGTAGMTGSADGTGAAARFGRPTGVAVDNLGMLIYVVDAGNHNLRRVTPAGVVATLAGAAGMTGSADGTGTAARFFNPVGIAMDVGGSLYISDTGNSILRKVTSGGDVTTPAGTAGMPGSADGTGADARFNGLAGVAVDSAGKIYIADQSNSSIRKITAGGVVTTLAGTAAGTGGADGMGAEARFTGPNGVAVDSAGNVYVADQANSTIRKITPDGAVTTLAGATGVLGSADGTGASARFSFPEGLAVDGAGTVYVADTGNQTIRKITPAGTVTTLAGAATMAGSLDGTGAEARFNGPGGVAVDSAGNLYVADRFNSTVRKITPAGVVTTLAGAALMFGSADGTGANARFNHPFSVAVDSAGNVYVSDRPNCTIRKITPAGVVTTLAGSTGVLGSADGTGSDARFNFALGVTIDPAGNVYVADTNNATIRKITPAGATTTIAGIAGMTGTILGATPRFSSPRGVAVVGDSLVISASNAIVLLRHGAR